MAAPAAKMTPKIHEVPDDLLAAIDFCYEQGWTDGLPVVPPTAERVEASAGNQWHDDADGFAGIGLLRHCRANEYGAGHGQPCPEEVSFGKCHVILLFRKGHQTMPRSFRAGDGTGRAGQAVRQAGA